MPEAEYGSLPFEEAIEFFREKLNIPTERWLDYYGLIQDEAFAVAGAMDADLIMDLREAVEKGIADGTTLAEFRKDFRGIVERYGWKHFGAEAWRARIIYDTNLRQAYNAGRYEQMNDPDVVRLRPYRQYRHGDSVRPREQHLAWDGLTLPADDPFWLTHTPQNGWGCKCKVFTFSDRDLARQGKSGPDKSPEIRMKQWTDKKTGETFTLPEGIDPGFEFPPGTRKFTPEWDKYPPELRRHMEDELQ